MTTTTFTLSYSRETTLSNEWFRLEQEPVTSNKLTSVDLQAMLALVQTGVSARAYKPVTCEASILADQVTADLALKVWTSSLDLPYELSADLVTIGTKESLEEWHEFDLIIPMETTVDLPYRCSSLTYTWQTPAYSRYGVEVNTPSISVSPTRLTLPVEVFGVLRIRCLALGWKHPLTFTIRKTESASITQLKPSVTLTWGDSKVERLELELPGCLEALLAFCPDGNSKRAVAQSTVDNDDDELVPVVYYSPCSGRMLTMRMEKP